MAKAESFDELISSIQEAFLSVNQMSERQHLETINAFFEEDHSPKTILVKYPYYTEDGSVDYKPIQIPIFCLVPVSSLKIKEINVDFKVKLSGRIKLKRGRTDDGEHQNNVAKGRKKEAVRWTGKETIGYIPSGYYNRNDDSYANITLKFLAEDPPEGVMRIRDEMIKILP